MLKNVLIVVDDIEKSIKFYRDVFGLQVILKNEGKDRKSTRLNSSHNVASRMPSSA